MDFHNLQLTSTKQFSSRKDIEQVLEVAQKMYEYSRGKKFTDILKNKVIATLFYEASTRTRMSFETACMRLGAKVISAIGMENSSLKKGETLEDTIRMVEQYADLIIMRHPEQGSADVACTATKKPFLNAGDGAGQHPTQALLDMYTIQHEQGKIDGLTIALVGDLKFGRTVHSLVALLKHFNINLIFVSPKELKMPNSICEELANENIQYSETDDLEKTIQIADVLYMTRVQEERFENPAEYTKLRDAFILTAELLKKAKESITILHPLPRITEIEECVDAHKGAAYFRQAGNGVPVRMALIAMALGVDGDL